MLQMAVRIFYYKRQNQNKSMTDREFLSKNPRAEDFSFQRPKKGLSAKEGNIRFENTKL